MTTAEGEDRPAPAKAPKKKRDASFYWYLAARVGAGVAGIASIRYLVSYLTREEYGTLGYYKVVGAALIPIVSLSLPAAMMRMYFDRSEDDHAGQTRLATTTFRLMFGAIALLVLLAGAYRLVDPDTKLFTYLALVATSTLLNGYFNYLTRVRDDYYLFFANRVMEFGGFLLLLVGAQIWIDQGGAPGWLSDEPMYGVIGMYAIAQWSVVLLDTVVYAVRNVLSLRAKSLPKAEIVELVRFSAPLSVTYFLGWMLNSSDAYILKRLSTDTELGDYVFAVGIVSFVGIISQSALTDWPRFYYAKMRDDKDTARRDHDITRRVRFFLALHIAAILILRLVVDFAYDLFGADEYRKGIDYLGYLLLGNYFFLAGNIYSSGLSQAKKTKLITIIWAVPGAVNVLLNILLIPMWGARAAALSTMVAFALFAVLGWVVSGPYYRFPDRLGNVIAAGAATAAALLPFG